MTQPRIFYFSFDNPHPTGGQKKIYQHVDMLNAAGYDATVVHTHKGFRLTWFPNQTPVITLDEAIRRHDRSRDVFVLPEDVGRKILSFPGRKVINNANVYYGFAAAGMQQSCADVYLDPSVICVTCVSEHNRQVLAQAFPRCPVKRLFVGIDSSFFVARPFHEKRKLITILPEKARLETPFLFHLLTARAAQRLNGAGDYSWCLINNNTEQEVASILRETRIFIFLHPHEGFGLLPLEAMCSGAIVVAYRSGPYCEYLNDDNAVLVEPNDTLGLVAALERVIEQASTTEGLGALQAKADRAREDAMVYSLDREQQTLLAVWREILGNTKTLRL